MHFDLTVGPYRMPAMYRPACLFPLLALGIVSVARAGDIERPVFMQHQILVESLAAKLAVSREVQTEKGKVLDLFRTLPGYGAAAGNATLEYSVDELRNAAALAAANSDPSRPRLICNFTPPMDWHGYHKAGTRWGGDNPDNIYRFFPIDEFSSYQVTVHLGKPGPSQYSFLLWDGYMGENVHISEDLAKTAEGETKVVDKPLGGLLDRDTKVDTNGSFVVTIDNLPANGRVNHIRSTSQARLVFIRDTDDEWAVQSPLEMQVQRIGGPAPRRVPTTQELSQRAAVILKGAGPFVARFLTKDLRNDQANTLSKPWARGGGWGFAANGQFALGDDEVLLVNVDPIGAKYLGAVVWNPWAVSPSSSYDTTVSLNNTQAERNKDGSYTYVVAASDPGVLNWLDTGGLNEGILFIRWQALPEGVKSPDGAVRSVRLVKLADLSRLLPAEATRVTPAMRGVQYAERSHAIEHHYGLSK